MIKTKGWVVTEGPPPDSRGYIEPAELRLETIEIPDITDSEVVVDPIVMSWEGAYAHVLSRHPIDICRARGEPRVVPGGAGVVRVVKCGAKVTSLHEGDLAMTFPSHVRDRQGYMVLAFGFDSPGSHGILALRTKMPANTLIALPPNSRHSLEQWAAFSVRYVTAWSNWRVAFPCWKTQNEDGRAPIVWSWGGGTAFAEVALAHALGAKQGAVISSHPARLQYIASCGLMAVDRREFIGLAYDPERFTSDRDFRQAYLATEKRFLAEVERRTSSEGVSIFIDNIGLPVYRATLKALARQGVLTTAGWLGGMNISCVRASECISRHLHINTHYARYDESCEAMRFAEETGWIPKLDAPPVPFEEVPRLADDYLHGRVTTYFPLVQIQDP